MPPTPHPSTPSPLIIVVCESVPTSESGYATVAPFFLLGEDDLPEVLEVDLVHDPRVGRHDAKILEGGLTPAEKGVPLLVAVELESRVDEKRRVAAVLVHLHRVIDDEIHRLQRVDQRRIAAQRRDGVAHCREVDDGGDAGEILEQHATRAERDLALDAGLRIPLRERLDVGALDEGVVLVSEQILQQHLERHRQPGRFRSRDRVQRVEAVDGVRAAIDGERRATAEGIE